MIQPRPHLLTLERTPPSTESRSGFIRLDHNERIIPFPDVIINRFQELLSAQAVMTYPEVESLYQMLASYLQVDRPHLLLASGSDLAIKTVYETYINPNDEILIHLPSYAMHGVYAKMFQAKLNSISYNAELQLNLDQFIESITPKTRMVVLENPNGFIGTVQSQEAIQKVIDRAYACGAIALIDEAYYLFSGQTVLNLYKNYDNVIITRTFSKDFGIAGLRFGYLISQEANIKNLYRVKPMHEVNSAAIAFAQATLEHQEYIDMFVSEVRAGLNFLKTSLNALGLATSDSKANFLVVRLQPGMDLNTIGVELKQKGFAIRRPFNVESLKWWLRIAAGNIAQMQQFMLAFETVLANSRASVQ